MSRADRAVDARLSVIVPSYNSAAVLASCLDALLESSVIRAGEIIVVDDASRDQSAVVASRTGVKLIISSSNKGPGAARNLGAALASGEVLVFVDADVAIAPDALGRLASHFSTEPCCDAVIGSYNAMPRAESLVSIYRNLMHYYVHQSSPNQASHFWAGIGAIRKSTFMAVGGFDELWFGRALEDVELGYRMRAAGYCIRLDRQVQGTHLKCWTLGSMLHTDLFVRAIPWTHLLLTHRMMPGDLSLGWMQRISVVLAWLLPLSLPVAFVHSWTLAVTILSLGAFLVVNIHFFRFLYSRRGWRMVLAAIPLHWIYNFNSGAGFVLGVASFSWPEFKSYLWSRLSSR